MSVSHIIGSVIGVLILLMQIAKPVSNKFRLLSIILAVISIYYTSTLDIHIWNSILTPFLVLVSCFISAIVFPYTASNSYNDYNSINGEDYYDNLSMNDKIGMVNVPGIKQTYIRILDGIITSSCNTIKEYKTFKSCIMSKNLYPISEQTKAKVISHINESIKSACLNSNNYTNLYSKLKNKEQEIFNVYVSIMRIHEDATNTLKDIERREKDLI